MTKYFIEIEELPLLLVDIDPDQNLGEIVGVDLMEDNEKLSVIEVNGTPQFKGVSTATKINIAAEIVDYIIENYR